MIEWYLSSHPVVKGLGASPILVHAALTKLHAHIVDPPVKERDTSVVLCNVERRSENCIECGSLDLRIDAREGSLVCWECGVVNSGGLNIVPEYNGPTDTDVREWVEASKRCRKTKGSVPKWLINSSRKGADEPDTHRLEREYRRELEHWNAYVHLSDDDLAIALHRLCGWKANGGDTRESRLAAALLYNSIPFPDENVLRDKLRRAKTRTEMEEIECGPPPPEFECKTCGAMHDTQKGSRVCCRFRFGENKAKRCRY